MSQSEANLTVFEEIVKRVHVDRSAERSVRAMLKGCADSCPTEVLMQLGQALIDEDFLRAEGVTDFARYRCDPDKEPPRVGFDYTARGADRATGGRPG
jgi:hypothetical protein